MIYLNVNFQYPWLLLLLIPLLSIVIYSFFKVNKRFRYSRTKITSFVLSIIYMLSVSFLSAGCNLEFVKTVDNNEVYILVDDSYSTSFKQQKKDKIVEDILNSTPENVKTGIIRFGYEPIVSLPLGKVNKTSYQTYIDSKKPLDIASNIESAINLATSSFSNTENSKIILIGDVIETDGDAKKIVASVALDGIKVDVLPISPNKIEKDVIIKKVNLPTSNVVKGKINNISIEIDSDFNTDSIIRMYDNSNEVSKKNVIIKKGHNEINFEYAFDELGIHELMFSVESQTETDTNNINNKIYSYINLETVNRVLILENNTEGDALSNMFRDNYKITTQKIKNAPNNIDDLREFDQIILANISNADMPKGFDKLLNQYVHEFGGSLLTIGGNKTDGTPNVYNRDDMKDTLYQEMLPVIAENYTPPVAVMFVVDCSGSMDASVPGTGKTRMEVLRESAIKAIRALDSRDYLGIVSFSSSATLELLPTPVADINTIEKAIKCLTVSMSSTVFTSGLNEAGTALASLSGVNQKHIILLTDGEPGDTEYIDATKYNFANGITTSSISFLENSLTLQGIADAGNGRCYCTKNGDELIDALKDDLSSPEIREFEQGEFQPKPGMDSSLFNGINLSDTPLLDGFYGTRLKKDAKALIVGEYNQPIYATWDYGLGKVSSFMCDLSGNLSSKFISDKTGITIISNIIDNLFPIASIKKKKIDLSLNRKNIQSSLNISSTPIDKDSSLKITINKLKNGHKPELAQTIKLNEFLGNKNVHFDLIEPGIYEIIAQKLDKNGQVYEEESIYESVSYSKEYDLLNKKINEPEIKEILKDANGSILDKPEDAYKNLTLEYTVNYDLRYVLIGITLVFFIGDLAVRKFKFKWIHEIIMDKKKKDKK